MGKLTVVHHPRAAGLRRAFGALAVASATFGVLIERWLFFAEAEHIELLYYGSEIA